MEPSTSYKRSSYEDDTEGQSTKKAKLKLNDEILKEECGNRKENDENKNVVNDFRNKKEENEFLRLFTTILNIVILLKGVDEIGIKQNVQPVTQSHEAGFSLFSFSATDFTKWENVCGYLHHSASLGANFARCRILNAINNCKMLELIFKKSDLRIICLGTGPGNDAVGLCSALSELGYPESLKITLVDKFKEWSLCIKLAEVLITEDNFGKVSELFRRSNVELSFIQTDLPGNLTTDEKYFQNLAEADVIAISKLNSILDYSSNNEFGSVLIQSLHERAKEDAIILLNDSFSKEMRSNFHLVYSWGNNNEYKYKSSALAEKRFNHNDAISSELPINVLVKKEPPDIFPLLEEMSDYQEFS